MAKKSKWIDLGLSRGSPAKSRKWVTDLRIPGSSRASSASGREIGEVDPRRRRLEMAELAELLGSHRDLVRPAPAEHVDGADRRVLQRLERPPDDVGAGELGPRLGEDAGDVERDIAVADHRRRADAERRIEIREIGMAVIPADEGGGADDPGQVAAGNIERPVVRGAGGQDDGVVEAGRARRWSTSGPTVTLPTKRTLAESATFS